MSLRAIVIDDTNPRLQYSGSWSADGVGGQDSFGTNGLTYNHTQHFTTANDSSLSFSFKGTSINVYGTVDVSDAYGWQNVIASSFEPPWECFVDSTSIGFYKPSSFHENNSPLCGSNSIASSSTGSTHNFTLKTWNMTQSATVWVDYLEYTPSSSDGEFDEDTTLLVPNNDSSISYDSSWTTVDGVATMTQTQGGKLSFNFTGTQLTWYGYIPISYPGNSTSASYSTDDSSPSTSFSLIGHAPLDGSSISNQIFFTTPVLANGSHTITVTYSGTNQYTPLTLSYMHLRVPATRVSNSTTNNDVPGPSHRSSIGPIVGGVVGGVVGLALILGLFWFVRRRQTSGRTLSRPTPFDLANAPPQSHSGYSESGHGMSSNESPVSLEKGKSGHSDVPPPVYST